MLDRGVENSPLHFLATEVILMNGFIIGIEVYLRLVHLLPRKDLLEDGHHVAQHLALPGLAADVHQEDKHLLGRDLVVDATWRQEYPDGPSTRMFGLLR